MFDNISKSANTTLGIATVLVIAMLCHAPFLAGILFVILVVTVCNLTDDK